MWNPFHTASFFIRSGLLAVGDLNAHVERSERLRRQRSLLDRSGDAAIKWNLYYMCGNAQTTVSSRFTMSFTVKSRKPDGSEGLDEIVVFQTVHCEWEFSPRFPRTPLS